MQFIMLELLKIKRTTPQKYCFFWEPQHVAASLDSVLLMGIRCGLVVTMPGSQAGWPSRYINVWHCGGVSMVLLQLKDPLELFVKRKEFLPS